MLSQDRTKIEGGVNEHPSIHPSIRQNLDYYKIYTHEIDLVKHIGKCVKRSIRSPILVATQKLFTVFQNISHNYSINPKVDSAVYPVGTSCSNVPMPEAFVPALETAVVPKYPLPKLQSITLPVP